MYAGLTHARLAATTETDTAGDFMTTKPKTTTEYLAGLTKEQRAGLQTLRRAIKAAAPKAQPAFSYGIPAFALGGKPFIWCAAWKKHFSIYPLSAGMEQEFADEVAPYERAKGTIRFPASEPLPVTLVKKLVKKRVAELRALAKSRALGAR
jgi:uncharacterized protein YdhG (YjbR/CyaY superfamily)